MNSAAKILLLGAGAYALYRVYQATQQNSPGIEPSPYVPVTVGDIMATFGPPSAPDAVTPPVSAYQPVTVGDIMATFGKPSSLQDIAKSAAAKYGIPWPLFSALVSRESGWNPNIVSPKGAQGLTQLMPATARELGVTNAFDPMQNLNAGARYLAQQFARFGNWSLALAAYNAGAVNVAKYGNRIPPFEETIAYVKWILSKAGMS